MSKKPRPQQSNKTRTGNSEVSPPERSRSERSRSERSRSERDPYGPMSRHLHFMELRAPLEAAAYVAMRPLLRKLHIAGDQHSVMVLPGGLGDDGSTFFLRWGIRNLGYSVHGWGVGRNLGLTEQMLAALHARVEELYALHNAKISLVGWSLGGIYARMLARDLPDKVRQVITLGSPFRMVETDQFAYNMIGQARWERMVKKHSEELDLLRVHEHDRPPITVPSTAIYSRTDGFAPWQLSIDEIGPNSPNPLAENVEVRGSHTGLSSNPITLAVVLDRLAQPEDHWRPFKPMPVLRRFYPPPATWTHPKEHKPRSGPRSARLNTKRSLT
jgi:pimeloyl-ACP methyl ester carboxylesterase